MWAAVQRTKNRGRGTYADKELREFYEREGEEIGRKKAVWATDEPVRNELDVCLRTKAQRADCQLRPFVRKRTSQRINLAAAVAPALASAAATETAKLYYSRCSASCPIGCRRCRSLL